MRRFFRLLALTLIFSPAMAQEDSVQSKKVVSDEAYEIWRSLLDQTISPNGEWVAYEVAGQEKDGWLYLKNLNTGKLDSVARGKDATFSYDNSALVFRIVPERSAVRAAKKAKKRPDDMPKDTVVVWYLAKDSLARFPNVKRFQLPEQSLIVGMHMAKGNPPKKLEEVTITPKKKKKKKKKKTKPAPPKPEIKSDGTELTLLHLGTGHMMGFEYCTDFSMADKADAVALVTATTVNKEDSTRVLITRDGQNGFSFEEIYADRGKAKNVSMDERGKQVAMLTSVDTAKTDQVYRLFLKKEAETKAQLIVDSLTTGLTTGRCPAENGRLSFTPNGQRLFFGVDVIPRKEPKDTLLEEEKHKVDVWSWNDERIMPQQLHELSRDKRFTYLSVYNIGSGKVVEVYDDSVRNIQVVDKGNGDLALGVSTRGYYVSQSWLSSIGSDIYQIDLSTGKRKRILKGVTGDVKISEDGKYVIYFEPNEKHWYSLSTLDGKKVKITEGITESLVSDNNGVPDQPQPRGITGWSEGDAFVYINADFDIWKCDPSGKEKPLCITKGEGQKNKVRFRFNALDKDERFVSEKYMVLTTFNENTKGWGLSVLENGSLSTWLQGDFQLWFKAKAKKSNRILFTIGTFRQYPDLYWGDLKTEGHTRISNVNPQQSSYRWGTVELIKWKSLAGRPLEGLLYKPEDFDATKKYPMLVYYYERNSDNLHQYRSPRPSASIINPSECVSQGYVVFIPDIEYREPGQPGKDAYDAIISGTKYVLSMGFVNEKKMGLQGQSWGGYQTAFMVTQTNLFAAAMAGAPVSNMTSAYGGIRWGSGLVRAFQYEHGQSRIGKNIWEDREAYIRNSPLFYVDKVTTPLLIMHNDGDGAVPWYQGIEMYSALRRLQKPVWLLNYNGDEHNLMKIPNRKDLSIRMRQFFDHYLMDAPAPRWMVEGVPATVKGKEDRYELTEPEKQ